MSTDLKYRALFIALLVCVCGLLAQAYYLWQLDRRYLALTGQAAPAQQQLSSLEEKILDAADKRQQATDPWADPFASMQSAQQRMDAIMSSMFGSSSLFASPAFGSFASPTGGNLDSGFRLQMPNVRLTETDSDYEIYVDVPDSKQVALNTEIEDNVLSITGTVAQQLQKGSGGSRATMLSQGSFSRRYTLDQEVDELAVSTEQVPTGLLVRVPKKTS